MMHFLTLHAMGRRRNIKHAPLPTPPQRPSSATVKPLSDARGEVQRDERPAPTRG